MRDNPNSELFEMHNEVSMLNRKIQPILRRVEEASALVKNASNHKSLSSQKGPVSLLSKMGGRLIAFYADDLSELLLEDFLTETAKDLQKIEAQERKKVAEKDVEKFAKDLLQSLADYQAEEQLVDMRWNNIGVQR